MTQLSYQEACKRHLIKSFIEDNSRVPQTSEINDLLKSIWKDNTSILRWNLLGSFDSESSADKWNLYLDDMRFNLDFLISKMEDCFDLLSLKKTNLIDIDMLFSKLSTIDSSLSSVLLDSNLSTNLIFSITENFATQSQVVNELTTCAIGSQGAYIKYNSLSTYSSSIETITYQVLTDIGFAYQQTFGDINTLKSNDGDNYIIEVGLKDSRSTIFLSIESLLSEPALTTSIRLSYEGQFDSVSLYIQDIDNDNYYLINTLAINNNIANFNFSEKTIRSFKFIISKTKIDTYKENNPIIIFALNSIEIFNGSIDGENVLVCGPYNFTTPYGESFSFSQVMLETCEINQLETWIEYLISTDTLTWIPISPKNLNTGGSIVSFENNIIGLDFITLDSDLSPFKLNQTLTDSTKYINSALDISYIDKIDSRYITIYRNIPTTLDVFDIKSGWFFDLNSFNYKTTFKIDSIDGITLSLGDTSAILDGNIVTGSNYVSSGFHTFETSQDNWFDITENLLSEKDLSQNDPLYPFNHKLIIEGYKYPSNFIGSKVYIGMSKYFGAQLKYVSKPIFDSQPNDLFIYTTYTDNNYIYFLVNTKIGYVDHVNETYEINIAIPSINSNSLYLKANLNSSDLISSPILKSFTLKVI